MPSAEDDIFPRSVSSVQSVQFSSVQSVQFSLSFLEGMFSSVQSVSSVSPAQGDCQVRPSSCSSAQHASPACRLCPGQPGLSQATPGMCRPVQASGWDIATLRHYDTQPLRHYDVTTHYDTLRHYDITTPRYSVALRHYDITTPHYDITTLRHCIYDITTLRHYDTTTPGKCRYYGRKRPWPQAANCGMLWDVVVLS